MKDFTLAHQGGLKRPIQAQDQANFDKFTLP